ncbi:MAG: tetratricopeptide repeat protein [Geitlerinemataceae cyanobacterium]
MRICVALWEVMDRAKINTLLNDLKNSDETVRARATGDLWRIWFSQKGVYGLGLLERAQALLDAGRVDEAEAKLSETIDDLPDFAEAWNRRAVLYYMQKQYDQAILDCQRAIELNSAHFGALHGLGLCYARRGQYREAIRAFQRALEIQPYALINQRLILECTAQLS